LTPKLLPPAWAHRAPSVLLVLALSLAAFFACKKQVVRFPHAQHLGMACGDAGQPDCLTCLSCHGQIARSPTLGHPTDQNCSACHENERHIQRVLAAEPTRAQQRAAGITFDHASHLALAGVEGQCIHCHAGVVSESSGPHFPAMSTCFGCHEHKEEWDRGTCTPCHQSAALRSLVPETFLGHGPGWDRRHGPLALQTTVQCAVCHSAESCDDCHDVSQGLTIERRRATHVEQDFIHPADFLSRHALEATSEPARCLSCHRTETCDSCHMSRGVSAGRMGAVNPHPPGWTGPDGLDPRHHGRAARRDILACASCHDQGPDTNCIDCHKVGGNGGNPHPSGWQSSRTPSDLMCSYCHEGP
jgi:hypothetical protein